MKLENDEPFQLPPIKNDNNIKFSRREEDIFDIIDNVHEKSINLFDSKSKQEKSLHFNDASINKKNYWNDWFGRPGNGARTCNPYKQNLEILLEPKKDKIEEIALYNASLGNMKNFKSNHYNYYELTERNTRFGSQHF